MRYPERKLTTLAKEAFIELAKYEFDELPGIEYFETVDEISLFREGIKEILSYLGYDDILNDKNKVINVLLDHCEKAGVFISRTTLDNWMTKAAPDGNKLSRENVYRLCFALRLNEYQTGEFFLKCYLERPYNYKNIREAAYFFCLKHGKSYSEAEQLIDRIESAKIIENPDADNVTETIGENIDKAKNEDEFVSYMIANKPGFAEQRKTATEMFTALCDKAKELAIKEYNLIGRNGGKPIETMRVTKLLQTIYWYSEEDSRGEDRIYNRTIKKSEFPKLVKRNFPDRQGFSQIKAKKASDDTLRKALIMLNFYIFFVNAYLEGVEDEILFDEFHIEMDEILMKCGYVQLYWRNPYDWIFGYCANTVMPLNLFRDLIQEYYLVGAE